MRRWLFTVASVISIVISGGTVAFWALDSGSTRSREIVLAVPTAKDFAVILFGGQIWCGQFTTHQGGERWDLTFTTDHRWSMGLYCAVMVEEYGHHWNHLGGFGAASYSGRPPGELFAGGRIIGFPAWVVLLPLSLPAWQAVLLLRKRHRIRANLCRSCGYDLRASPERCPECGTAVNLTVDGTGVSDAAVRQSKLMGRVKVIRESRKPEPPL
jgi:hypothetical protein